MTVTGGRRRTRVGRGRTYENMHLGKHVVGLNEFVGDTHALGLHGVVDAVGVGADVGWGRIRRRKGRRRRGGLTVIVVRNPSF